ncbi:hypothetical protein [Clostridium sp.]|nr:hypothetical protein [Clostridium sp.]
MSKERYERGLDKLNEIDGDVGINVAKEVFAYYNLKACNNLS